MGPVIWPAGLVLSLIFVFVQVSRCEDPELEKTMNQIEKAVPGMATISAKIPKKTVAGEQLSVLFEIQNTGDRTVKLNGDAERSLLFQVEGKGGIQVPKSEYGKSLDGVGSGISSRVLLELVPGKTASAKVNLHRLFDISLPGGYSVTIEVVFLGGTAGAQKVQIGTLEFLVTRPPHSIFRYATKKS